MARFGFTFGLAYNLGRSYVMVEARDSDEAREIFVRARGDVGELPDADRRWAFQYPEAQMLAIAERHNLTEVPIDTPICWADPANPQE